MVERVIRQARITYRLAGGFNRSFPQPLTYMTMRDKFDNLLAERAVSAGASLRDESRVSRVEVDGAEARIFAGKDVIAGNVVVGADGADSVIARQLGLLQRAEVGVGLESEVYTGSEYLEPWGTTVGLDLGTIRGGYMWVFPKGDHLSIGAAGFKSSGPRLRHLLAAYLHSLQLGDYESRLTRGHRLLRRRQGTPIQRGNALLLGDAAGMLDIWTGEGIYYALRSAQMAAPDIGDYLQGRAEDLSDYERSVDRELMPELHIARTLTRIGVGLPRLAYTLMKRSDWAWNAGCEILRAEKSYHDVRSRMGRFSFLFDIAGIGT